MSDRPSATPLRPSACPGLWRIVQAKDGGICRIKLAGGVLSAAQARAVAMAARQFGSGVIETTNRANLQLRGVQGDSRGLIDTLLDAGLGSRDAGADDVRNVMISPAAGRDAQAQVDTRPLAAQILASLQDDVRLHGLSAKFSIQLDGGEWLQRRDHHHDLWLSAIERDGQAWLAFGLAGCPALDAPLGEVPLAAGHELVLALLLRFLERASPDQHRLRQWLEQQSAQAFIAGLPVSPVKAWQPATGCGERPLGAFAQRDGRMALLAAPALGRLDAEGLERLAEVAERYSTGQLCLTPWQSVLLPDVVPSDADNALVALASTGLSISSTEPLSRLIACTGSTGCAKAHADTKADARQFALIHPGDEVIHLSGCERSCAAAHPAPLTLLAVAPGRYDLYRRAGLAPGFGQVLARNLTLEQAGALLDRPMERPR